MNRADEILEKLEDPDPQQGVQLARSYLESSSPRPESRSRLSYGLAVGYFKMGAYERSLSWLQRTEDPRRWMMKGFAHQAKGEHGPAAEAFHRASEQRVTHRRKAQ